MASKTEIEWADRTWNPITGCTQISLGCENCYARALAKRLQAMGNKKYKNGFEVTFHESALNEITPGQKSALIFPCSMSDIFHPLINSFDLGKIFAQMDICRQHRFMLLTKRSRRMFEILTRSQQWGPLPNVALGITIENQARLDGRLYNVKNTPAAYRFISVEPMLGPVKLADADPDWYRYIDLVIVGGESGPKARPVHPQWVEDMRDQCGSYGVPFCFKQWGEWAPKCVCKPKMGGVATVHSRRIARPEPGPAGHMSRCGKKAAGRLLLDITGKQVIHDGAIDWRA